MYICFDNLKKEIDENIEVYATRFEKEEIKQKAKQLYLELLKFSNFSVSYEATDSIGKNYHRQDTIGTYYCLTVDYSTVDPQSPDYNTITIRYRDTMKQERKSLNEIAQFLNQEYLNYYQQLIR